MSRPPATISFGKVLKAELEAIDGSYAVRRDRYIGLCYGPPGVGKTASAPRYACWHELEPLLRGPGRHFTEGRDRTDWHTLLYTPTVSATPRMIAGTDPAGQEPGMMGASVYRCRACPACPTRWHGF